MTTNIFDDIALVRGEFDDSWQIESLEAVERLDALRQQYNALAPDWAQAPVWAQWYTIDMDGFAYWRVSEPVFDTLAWKHTSRWERTVSVDLPVGIDSRLCKWQRPQVQP